MQDIKVGRYTIKKLTTGEYAVFTGKQFFTDSRSVDLRTVKIYALHESARWHQNKMDKIQSELYGLDAINHNDPQGYLA